MNNLDIFLTNPWFLFWIGFLGMLAHFLKKFQKDELGIKIINPIKEMYKYFLINNLSSTLLTVIAYMVSFLVLFQIKDLSIFSVFSAGYMADSIFNKAEEKFNKTIDKA